jgi:hypothetical protein
VIYLLRGGSYDEATLTCTWDSSQGSRSPRLASSYAVHMAPGSRLKHLPSPAIARAAGPLYPVRICLHRLLVRFNPRRVYRHAAASRCIRLDIRKANRGRRCRTVCKCDLQARLASCTPGHLCYDENVGPCRLVLARRALSQLSSQVSTFG